MPRKPDPAKPSPRKPPERSAAAGTGSYIRAKLALLGVTRTMQDELGARGITFVALHPGVIPGTRFGSEMPAFLRESFFPAVARLFRLDTPIDEAAARYVRLATERVEPAGFYYEGVLRPLPTLAAVNGAAVGAGMNLALGCDLRLAARRAKFDTRFLQIGIHPGGGHTWMLRRIAGRNRCVMLHSALARLQTHTLLL